MYAQVVVLTYQPPSVDSYTYEIPKGLDIKIGQLVEVPFGKRNPQGIVTEIHNKKPNVTTKPITKIVIENPILLPYQIELLKWMSEFYIASTVNCLEAMLPKIPKKFDATDQKSIDGPAQSLVLVPSINRLPETLAKFPKAKNYAVYHNEQKPKEHFETWLKIASGKVDYVFSSRAGIFSPCQNLKEIIIYDEHDGAYKDIRSPYYDTLTVAQKIAELTKAQIKIVDPSPKITTYYELKNHIKIQKFSQKVEVVNMQNEKLSDRHSPISFDLEEEIKNTDGNILLFLNKKKESGHLFCKSCKTSQHLEKQPATCPYCQSPDIFWNVLNIETLSKETEKLFPGKKIDIFTAQVLYAPIAKKYTLIAHIQPDSLLYLTDYASAEKLYAQTIQLKKLLTPQGRLILQTYNPEHHVFSVIETGDYSTFYKSELKERKLMSYPPYSILCKFTVKNKSVERAKDIAEVLVFQMDSQNSQNLKILGPYKSLFWKKTPSYHIIAKYPVSNYLIEERFRKIQEIKKMIKTDKSFQIEVDPISIQ